MSAVKFNCPHCKQSLEAPEDLLGKTLECPACNGSIQLPAPVPKATRERPAENTSAKASDTCLKIAAWVAGGGLLLLALSPFFKWVNFGSGGVTGLSGDGKIVLGLTVVAIAAYITAMATGKWLTPALLGVQSYGTLAVFWMGALIWKVGSILGSGDMKDNPFAALIATQISPGAGLYLGLIGGIGIAGALGFVIVRRFLSAGSLKPYYATQGLSLALGMLLAFFGGPSAPSRSESTEQEGGDLSWAFPGATQAADRAAAQAKWRKTHGVSDRQWDEMIANFKARKQPESVSTTDWWEEAKEREPAEIRRLYPPLQPRELYRAEWAGVWSGSRELDRDFSFGERPATYRLTLKVLVRTEPNVPMKELHGHLAFVKDGEIIYETQIGEKPDVSFTDRCLVWLAIDPYDDDNKSHRTLRYAKDTELTPVFTVNRVVLADGTERTFD